MNHMSNEYALPSRDHDMHFWVKDETESSLMQNCSSRNGMVRQTMQKDIGMFSKYVPYNKTSKNLNMVT